MLHPKVRQIKCSTSYLQVDGFKKKMITKEERSALIDLVDTFQHRLFVSC